MTSGSGDRLWDRLARGREDESFGGRPDLRRMLESVRSHLEWLLNTHQGDSAACPEYGLPDITNLVIGLPYSERQFCRAIENSIKEHEPRVTWVRVSLDDREEVGRLTRHFTVEIGLRDGEGDIKRLPGAVDIDAVFHLSA